MKEYFIVFGSSIEACRPERSSGNAFAEGCSDPFLQKSGFSIPRTEAANHTRPLSSNMPLWLLARWFQIFSSPQYAEAPTGFIVALGCSGGPNVSGISGSATGILKNVTLWVFGSRIGISSDEYSFDPYSGPLALTVGCRRSEEIKSCTKCFSVAHSHDETTTLRSMPVGRGGFALGSSPPATRSVQSPKYLNGTPPSWPARRLTIHSPVWPEATRRAQASSPDLNSPSCAGMVRVDSCPSWWQPMQSTLPMRWRQSSRVTSLGMSLAPPKSFAGGMCIIAYQ